MNRLKELRQEKGLSQKELAKDIGVHYRTLQNWENEKAEIKQDKAQQLADFFEVEVGYLLGYNEGHRRVYELLGMHPKKGNMGIVTVDELIDAYNLGFINDKRILDNLQSDSTVAIKFLESIQQNLSLFGDISHGHTREIERYIKFLKDLRESAEKRQTKLSNNIT